MKLRNVRQHRLPSLPFLLILVVSVLAAKPATAQPVAAETYKAAEGIKQRIEAAALTVGNNPRFKKLSPAQRKELIEFVSGNLLFVLLHELSHAVVSELEIPVLGKDEDAADSYAATRLIRLQNGFSEQVVASAAKGWFLSDLRDKKEGDSVPYYDAHGLNLQRAYQFVCFLVGAEKDKFKKLADETKLPPDRQDSCATDYDKALKSWDAVLKPHLRTPDQPKSKVEVVYGEGVGELATVAQISRDINLLEPVAEITSNLLVWPVPIVLEMQTCGFVNAAWVASTKKLTLCYELAADFSVLYREYGTVQASAGKASSRKRKSR